jgi:Tfp pilus assembly protein PilF/TolB-like protein
MNKFFNRKQKTFRGIVGVLIYSLIVFPGLGSTSWGASVLADETKTLTAKEKQNLVQHGVDQYKQGNLGQAQKNLELAKKSFPENYAVPYYLGLIYLEQGKRSAAINEWQEYVKMDPKSVNALRIRKNLTLLLLEEARDSARTAVANEAVLTRLPPADNTVAVGVFTNLGSESIEPLGKGIAALLIYDLSQVPDLRLVERVRLQTLIKEMQLGTSGMITPETAPTVGKLLKAKHVTSGSMADLEADRLLIASALMDADQMTNVGTQEAQGELSKFFILEKQIACQIIEDLGWDCDTMPAEFHKIHTQSLAALIFFGMGLDFMDQEQYDQARDAFQKALNEDPSFELAQHSLLNTPVPEMQFMATPGGSAGTAVIGSSGIGTTEGMIAMAASHGVSADAAGTATAVGTTLAAGATGGVGVGATIGIIAGAAAIGGLAVAAGGGGGDDDGGGGGGGVTPVAQCNEQQVSGGDSGDQRTIEMGQSTGTFILSYETQNIPDQIVIRQSGTQICNTGCVSTGVGVKFQETCNLNGTSTVVDVEVIPNCDGTISGTYWEYIVNCP